MPIEVYKEPLQRRYYVSSACSMACIYMIVISFLMIFLPLFLGYNSTGFWLKDNTEYEQPHVQYTYQAIFHFYGQRTTTTNGVDTGTENFVYYWSTETLLNDVHNADLRPAQISSIEVDDDRNGLMDRLDLTVLLPLMKFDVTSNSSVQYHEVVTGIDATIFYEVRLQDRAKYIVDAVTYFSHRNGGEAMGKLFVDSNIEFKQREALKVKGGFHQPYQDDPLLPVAYEDTSLEDVEMSTVLAKSASRNLTLQLNHNYVYATPEGGDDAFNVDFKLRVPPQYIIYTPAVSEVLKFAWVQYMSIFLVIFFLLDRMNSFVFTHKLLYAHQVPDMIVKKMD